MGAQFDVALSWERAPDGVVVCDFGPPGPNDEPEPKTAIEKVARAMSGKRRKPSGIGFQPRTGRIDRYRIETVNLEQPAVLSFVNANTPERMAAFYSMFGPLTDHGYDDLTNSNQTRELVERLSSVSVNSDDGGKAAILNEHLFKFVKLHPEFDYGNGSPKGRVVLYANDLFRFMAAELAVATMSGVRLMLCENCGDAFFTGGTSGRRSDAKTCSNRCRMAYSRKSKTINASA